MYEFANFPFKRRGLLILPTAFAALTLTFIFQMESVVEWYLATVSSIFFLAWFLAISVLHSRQYAPILRAHLTEIEYDTFYRFAVSRVIKLAKGAKLYDKILVLSIFYPFSGMVLFWGFNVGNAEVSTDVLPENADRTTRTLLTSLLVFTSIVVAVASRQLCVGLRSPAGGQQRFQLFGYSMGGPMMLALAIAATVAMAGASATLLLQKDQVGQITAGLATGIDVEMSVGAGALLLSFCLACLVALAGAAWGAGTGAITGAVVGSATFGGTLAYFGSGASLTFLAVGSAFFFSVLFAFATAIIDKYLHDIGQDALAYTSMTILILAVLSIAMMAPRWSVTPYELRTIFLFFGILPILNAVFDYASVLVTLFLVKYGSRSTIHAIICALVDLIIAILIGMMNLSVFILIIDFAHDLTGVKFLNFDKIIADFRSGDVASHAWLLATAFSTLIPTFIHLVIASLSCSQLIDLKFRRNFVKKLDEPERMHEIALPAMLGAIWAGCLIVPLGAICVIGYLMYPGIVRIASFGLDQIESTARLLGAL